MSITINGIDLVLLDFALRPHTATDEEKQLASEVAQLRALLTHGDAHHDVTTLRHVQTQKNKVVASALAFVEDHSGGGEALSRLIADARELTRITTSKATA
jgi:hypothetical protein